MNTGQCWHCGGAHSTDEHESITGESPLTDITHPKPASSEIKPQYSGDASRAFWAAVDTLQHGDEWEALYSAGVKLQEDEARVLKLLVTGLAAELRRRTKT